MSRSLADLLPQCMPCEYGWKLKLLASWPHIVGSMNNAITIERIENDTLLIGAPTSCWMHELNLLSDLLLQKINQTLDQPRITRLRFKKVTSIASTVKKEMKLEQVKYSRTMSIEEKKALAMVQDKGLAQALESFFNRCF